MGVCSAFADDNVAKIGDTEYATLQEALNAGGDVTLLADVDLGTGTVSVASGTNVVLDLSGHEIKSSKDVIYNGGTLTIKDSSTEAKGKITSTGDGGVGTRTNSTTTIEGGTISSVEGAVFTGSSNGATINIKGGTFTASDNFVLAGNGTKGYNNNTWNITGGTFEGKIKSTGYIACGIYAPNNDTWNISGGTFNITGGAGIVQRAGTVTVSGNAKFNVTGEGSIKGKVGDSRVVVPCSALVFDAEANYPGLTDDAKMIISGGEFTSAGGTDIVTVTEAATNRIAVQGGTFSSNPTDFLAYGYGVKQNDSKWEVAELTKVAQIGETKYVSLQDAFDAGGEITLLENIDLGASQATVAVGKVVTLDLNGKEIKSSGQVIHNGGTLTIKDSGEEGKITSGDCAIAALSNSTTIIGGGNIHAQEAAVINGKNTNAKIKITGGTFTAVDNAVLMANGTRGYDNNTWEITGGTFNGGITSAGYVACGIYAPNNDTWTISGGTFNITGGAGVVQRAGTVTITGGTFNVTGNATGKVGDSRVVVPCSALVFDESANYPGLTENSQMIISGGNFTSEVATITAVEGTSANRISVQGGTYSNDVTDFVAEGYEAVKKTEDNADSWTVGKVTATEITEGTSTEEGTANYTATKKVVDSEDKEIASQTITVSVSGTTTEDGETAPAGEVAISQVDLQKVVEAVIEATDLGSKATVTVSVELEVNAERKGGVVESDGVKTITFDVKPEAIVTIGDASESTTVELSNDDLAASASFTFTLDVTSLSLSDGAQVKVVHKSSDSDTYPDETFMTTVTDNKVTITTTHFSEFEISNSSVSTDDDVVITDGSTPYNITTATTVKSITYNRTFSDSQKDKYQAWFVPFDYTITGSENATFYRISFIAAAGEEGVVADENAVYLYVTALTSGTTLKGNRPYLIVPTAAETMTFTPASKQLLAKADDSRLDMSTAKNTYNFYGTYDTKNATVAHEFLGMNGGQICWNASASATLGAYRWYITLTSRDGNADYSKLRFVITDEEEEDATGIAHVINMIEDVEGYYSLNGTRLNTLVKGVNIVKFKNGEVRKVYIK